MLEALTFAPCRSTAQAVVHHCAPSQVRRPRANIVAASFTRTRAEARERVLPRHPGRSRSSEFSVEAALSEARGEPRAPSRAPSGRGCATGPAEAGLIAHRHPLAASHSSDHRSGPRAQDTQRGRSDVSHGVRFLSAYDPRRSLCRFTSPTPSALGVSHSLSGLSPPGPRGFVSRHIRP